MPARRVLILGGTKLARDSAGALMKAGFHTITSLAGVTSDPVLPPGEVRRGGFGGVTGLCAFITAQHISDIVDATHPFAARISRHGAEAARISGVRYFRIESTAWEPEAGDVWIHLQSTEDAVAHLPGGARVLVTVGRKDIGSFFARDDIGGVARMIEVPTVSVPSQWTLLRERPPFDVSSENKLMQSHAITHLVTKNAGGEMTRAKLHAARALKIPVLMIARPKKPPALVVQTVDELLDVLTVGNCP